MISLEELRKKPPEVKQRITLITALVLTGLIAVAWLFSLSLQSRITPQDGDAVSTGPGPIQGIIDGFKNAFDDIKNIDL